MIRREENVKGPRKVCDTQIRPQTRKRACVACMRVQYTTRRKKRKRKKYGRSRSAQSAERTGSRHDRESARSIVHQPPRLLLRAPAWRHARKQLVAPILPALLSGHSYISWEGSSLSLALPPRVSSPSFISLSRYLLFLKSNVQLLFFPKWFLISLM